MMTPSVGRIVHYQPLDDQNTREPLAAVITKVHNPTTVDLHIFPCWHIPGGRELTSVVLNATGTQPGRCNWPPRV